jgi:hypothetical protein
MTGTISRMALQEDRRLKKSKYKAMENTMQLSILTPEEVMACNGGGFVYDLGCVVGFVYRSFTAGQATAYAVWFSQHPDK